MNESAATLAEAFDARCRQVFQTGSSVDELVKEFRGFDNDRRIVAWGFLLRAGIEDMEFARFVYHLFSPFIMEVFGAPVVQKVT